MKKIKLNIIDGRHISVLAMYLVVIPNPDRVGV